MDGKYIREVVVKYRMRKARKDEVDATYLALAGSPSLAAALCREIAGEARECQMVLLLNSRNMLVGTHLVAQGTVNRGTVYIRELFRAALAVDAVSIILAHNHPGGRMDPSNEDINATKEVEKAAKTLDIQLLDHIIVSQDMEDGELKWVSLAERGHI